VPKEQIAAVIAPQDLARIRVEQQLGRIEALPVVRRPRTVHAIAVDQPRAPAGQQPMPDAIGAGRQPKALLFALAGAIEEAKLDSLRIRRHQCEVDAAR
jgi:hypothetical protein